MKINVFGGSEGFKKFLMNISGVELSSFSELDEALSASAQSLPDVLFILPRYGSGELSLGELREDQADSLNGICHNKNVKLYIENYPSFDYRDRFFFGIQARAPISPIGRYTVALTGRAGDALGFEILEKKCGYYIPNGIYTGKAPEVLAEVKNCFGTHKIVGGEEGRQAAALSVCGENIYFSSVDLTNLDQDGAIFSYRHWRSFYTYIFGELLGCDTASVKKAFDESYKKIGIKKDTRPREIKSALESAVLDAIGWHENSGVLLERGRRGVYEMVRSFDLGLAKNIRGDSALFTALLFAASGKYFKNRGYTEVADNIISFVFDERKLQIEEGENKGLFLWFSGKGDGGSKEVYISDTSRASNSLLGLYKLTGDEKLRERVISAADAVLAWFGGCALLPRCSLDSSSETLSGIQTAERISAVEFYDAPLIFLRNAYLLTGNERYRDQVFKTAEALASLYPNYKTVTSLSDSFTYGRLLGALSAAQSLGAGKWTAIIDPVLNYFERLQDESGGFKDGGAYYDEKSFRSDLEFAVGFGEPYDKIADLVYCQNTLAYSLNILNGAKDSGFDREKSQRMLKKLTDFLLDAQIKCDNSRVSGAWMRAFDLDGGEYYGCDKDFAWGPYCILTGWVTAAIPLVFLDLLGLETIY